MGDRISYRVTLPKPVLAALAAEARRRSSTPSRVLESLVRRHLAHDVSLAIERSLRDGQRAGGEVPEADP